MEDPAPDHALRAVRDDEEWAGITKNSQEPLKINLGLL